jgi:hypothetical protein
MYCGEKDPEPNRDGCPAMTAAKSWVTQYGASVKLLIDDPVGDHTGFMTNSANVNAALAQFTPAVRRTLSLVPGWNLVSSSGNSAVDVATTLADSAKLSSVWKWSPSKKKWAFYAPSLTPQELLDYASTHGFDVLTSIQGGEGFWIQSKVSTLVELPAGTSVSSTTVESGFVAGWNLAGVGATRSPPDFDALSLWAWEPVKGVWYFYAGSLDTAGTLAASIQSSGYVDFAAAGKKLVQGTGFWVDKSSAGSSAVLKAPSSVVAGSSAPQTVGGQSFGSSTQLAVSWVAPASSVDHFEVSAIEPIQNTKVTQSTTANSVVLTALKSATPYTVVVKSCADAACKQGVSAAAVQATTSSEYWQLQGSGNTTASLSRIVSDGNARISATRFGPEAGGLTANRIQLYYGPSLVSGLQALSTALTASATSAAQPSSYLSFVTSGATTGILTPTPAATLVKTVATGQGVPLSAAMGGKVRVFFEATGADLKTRIFSIDSVDGYNGQDFNSSSTSTTCSTTADFSTGGGCAFSVAVGVEGDTVAANAKILNARQNKVGYPTQTDWRWDGAPGTFMVFTSGSITGCSTANRTHGYAVWNGSTWDVQYDATGCPKLFTNVQAAFPMHIGGVRYKLYYGDTANTTGQLAGSLPFLGPKRLLYADGAKSGLPDRVDFEDWENQANARNVVFLWPNGDALDSTAEGYIDDFHFLTPTGSLDLQVMYLAITNGVAVPLGAAAILLNP